MKSRFKLWIAGLAALLVGMPLAEKAAAEDGAAIAWSAIDLAAAITGAAISAS